MLLAASREPISGTQLAEQLGCARRYLEADLQRLRRAGMLEGRRGKAGGYRLARAPARITLGEVIAAVGIVEAVKTEEDLVSLALVQTSRAVQGLELTLADALEEAEARGLVSPRGGWDFCI